MTFRTFKSITTKGFVVTINNLSNFFTGIRPKFINNVFIFGIDRIPVVFENLGYDTSLFKRIVFVIYCSIHIKHIFIIVIRKKAVFECIKGNESFIHIYHALIITKII